VHLIFLLSFKGQVILLIIYHSKIIIKTKKQINYSKISNLASQKRAAYFNSRVLLKADWPDVQDSPLQYRNWALDAMYSQWQYCVQSLTKSPPAVFKGFYTLNLNGFWWNFFWMKGTLEPTFDLNGMTLL
jgi:hypothetical protein